MIPLTLPLVSVFKFVSNLLHGKSSISKLEENEVDFNSRITNQAFNMGLPTTIIQKHSPNYTPGRHGHKPIAIVIHIMDGTLIGTDSWFEQLQSKVSAHYGIGKSGEIHQYVQENDTAQHAGVVEEPTWKLLPSGVNPNLVTIGIEHEGVGGDVFTPEQFVASAALIADIATRWDIPLDEDHVIPHHAIRATKTCPGAGVDVSALILRALNPNNDHENDGA